MTNKRKGRPIKTILGQNKTKELKAEITEEYDLSGLQRVMDVESLVYPDDEIDGEKEVEPELESDVPELEPELNEYIEKEYMDEEKAPKRTMDSLSKSELRWFQRTGKMPK